MILFKKLNKFTTKKVKHSFITKYTKHDSRNLTYYYGQIYLLLKRNYNYFKYKKNPSI